MRFRVLGLVGLAVLLSACSDADWNNMLSFDSGAHPETSSSQIASSDIAPPDAMPAAMAPQPNYSVTQTVTTTTTMAPANNTVSYCQTVARGSGATATRDGMDNATQQQAADAIYHRCLTFYGASGQ